jgi:hypothetical protein
MITTDTNLATAAMTARKGLVGFQADLVTIIRRLLFGEVIVQGYYCCKYCGKQGADANMIKSGTLRKWELILKTTILAPICLSCFSKVTKKIIPVFATTSDMAVRAKLDALSHNLNDFTESTKLQSFERAYSIIKACEVDLQAMTMEFVSKATEAQMAADKVEWMKRKIDHTKRIVYEKLGISYDHCRKLANQVISDDALRNQVFERDQWHCKSCGATERLSVDHIVPVVKGGGNELENLQTLCLSCNSSKGSEIK